MATNPQSLLNQTVPASQQPTAGQPTLQQAGQVLPADQFPSAGASGFPAFASPSTPSTSVPLGSSTTSPIPPGSLGAPPQLQPYFSSLPYIAALEQQPQLGIPDPGDPLLASIQQKLLNQQQSNALLTGKLPPQPTSKLATTQSPMSPLQLIETAGQNLWHEEVVAPVHDYIHTWQTNPGQAFLETLGGVAVTAGLVGLEVATGGAATPFIFAGLAALQAPNLIQAWSQEITNPSDANLVRAMVSTGAGALAVGSPMRAFRGIQTARNLLEFQIDARKALSSVDDASKLLIGRARGEGQGVTGLRAGDYSIPQLGTLDLNNVEVLRDQLQKRGANLEKGPAEALLRHSEVVQKLRADIYGSLHEGHVADAQQAMAELQDYVSNEMRDPFLTTAYNYVFLPQAPFAHVPIFSLQGVTASLQESLNQRANYISGLLRRMHLGHGLQTVSDMATQNIASLKEAEALDQAAGTPHDSLNRIWNDLLKMQEEAGVKGEVTFKGITGDLPSPASGFSRLFRAEVSPENRVDHPDWIQQGLEESGAMAARDRWFTSDPKHLEFYKEDIPDFQKTGRVSYVDVPEADAEKYRASNLPEGRFSAPGMAQREFYVPFEVSEKRQEVTRGLEIHEAINQALEEPEKWKQLTPDQQAYAQKLRDIFDSMTAGDLRYGHISQPVQGITHRYFTGVSAEEGEAQKGVEEAARKVYTSSYLQSPVGVRSNLFRAAIDDETHKVGYRIKTRAEIIKDQEEQARNYEATHDLRQLYTTYRSQFQTWNRSLGQLKRNKNDAGVAKLEAKVKNQLGDLGVQLLRMSESELNKVRNAAPVTEELVTGLESVKRALTNHVLRMQHAAIGEALQAHSNMGVSKLRRIFSDVKMPNWGGAMAEHPKFRNTSAFPDVLPRTVFEGARNAEEAAQRLGYFKIFPEVGIPGELNHRSALYGRSELANEISKAMEESTSAQQQLGVSKALYKVTAGTKRYIMYNPVYHFLNVAGRALAFVGSDPGTAGTALKAVTKLNGEDPAAFHDLLQEASMSGMVPATQWNVAEHLRILQREEDGQHSFFGAIRNWGRALDNKHRDTAERGLWSAVDHLQLAGYVYSKQRFLDKGIKEFEARQLAATYANNLGGMVNPLYMSRLWRQLKGMVFFAPSYWSTFLHALQTVVPGNARLSHAMSNVAGGRLVGLTSTPLRTMDLRARIELSRAQRDWMVTYLAATAVSMDMLNVMLSGHHLWDNEQGHEWNIDVTNLPGFGGTQTSPSGEVKRAYITANPFFRQGVDIGNAIGLGHDWGLGHVFGDKTWQQQDVWQKMAMAGGALLDGVRKTASTKLGAVPQAAGNLLTGQDVTSFLGTGTQVKVDRPQALLGLLPNGYQLERLYKTYQQAYQQYSPGTQEYKQAQQQWQQLTQGQNLLPTGIWNLLGLPSVYHMGIERPPIDDSKFENWITQRDASHKRLSDASKQVFTGQLSPLEYARLKQQEQVRVNQLNLDTWGNSSPGASLSASYQSLATQFGLDSPGLSTQDWFERYDAFLPAWNQLLQSAAPATRAAWWEHSTMQWTDADYLEWEARQLRDSLAASIDHQGGSYIRKYQNWLFRMKPTMTVSEYQQAQQADPYYLAYTTLLKEMGKTSALGAFVSAFSSPYSTTYIPPAGLTSAQAQELSAHTGQVVVRPEMAQQLATQAKQIAQEPQVAQAGGQPEASPEFQQQEQQALAAAQSGVPQGQ